MYTCNGVPSACRDGVRTFRLSVWKSYASNSKLACKKEGEKRLVGKKEWRDRWRSGWKEGRKESIKTAEKQEAMEGRRETGREGGSKGGRREAGREAGRKGGRQGGREGGREGGRKDMGREGAGLWAVREGKERKEGKEAKRKTKERKEASIRVEAFVGSTSLMDNLSHIHEVASNLGSTSSTLSSLVFVPPRSYFKPQEETVQQRILTSKYFLDILLTYKACITCCRHKSLRADTKKKKLKTIKKGRCKSLC